MPSKKPKTPKTIKPSVITAPEQKPTASTTPRISDSGFEPFADLVVTAFQRVAGQPNVFVVNVDGDALYAHYLAAFPEGTNPIVKQRTEHDCATCRQFVRRVGNVVTIDGSTIKTVWDDAAVRASHPYNLVATQLRDIVRAVAIADIFRLEEKEGAFGAKQTRHLDSASGLVVTHHHFYTGEIPKNLRVKSPGQERGEHRTAAQVFERGLRELLPSAFETVLDLMADNNLYRGEEHQSATKSFYELQKKWLKMDEPARSLFCWVNSSNGLAKYNSTLIAELVRDIAEGKSVDSAVGAFESRVAGPNYKRPKALMTPAMAQRALATIAELDLEPALQRRFAVLGDISVKDVLWVDGVAKPVMKGGGLGDIIMKAAVEAKPKSAKTEEEHAETIGIEEFLSKVLPETTGVELFFENGHLTNLMALTAPVHPEPKQLFRWDNDFAWSYAGNMADSDIRKAVQAKGGRVDGAFRFSHSWNHAKRNASLMDLHVFMPGSTVRPTPSGHCDDYYGNDERVGWNRRNHPRSGGIQDVDYTAAAPAGFVPVENTTFPDLRRMPEGKYVCKIHNWQWRPPTEGGFRAEIECGGRIYSYDYQQPLKNKEWVTVATVTLKDGLFSIEHHLACGSVPQDKWGLRTEQYVRVSAVTLSPNYWGDSKVGNRHFFFVLEGAKCDEAMRGIYNEFLHSRLEQHRKAFEIIGDKTKCQPTDGALAGLGFSSTKKDNVIVRVNQGKKRRLYNVQFGGAA